MWDDELLERIPSTSATNIEAGLRDRVRELRDRGMSCGRIGSAPRLDARQGARLVLIPSGRRRWPHCGRVARSRRAVRWPSTPAAGLHRQGQDFAGAHEAFLTDELARRVRRQSGSVEGPVEGDALILLRGNPVGMQLTVRNVGRVHNYRCSTCVASVRSGGGRGERLVRGQALAEAA
jgi:hypothetical protein